MGENPAGRGLNPSGRRRQKKRPGLAMAVRRSGGDRDGAAGKVFVAARQRPLPEASATRDADGRGTRKREALPGSNQHPSSTRRARAPHFASLPRPRLTGPCAGLAASILQKPPAPPSGGGGEGGEAEAAPVSAHPSIPPQAKASPVTGPTTSTPVTLTGGGGGWPRMTPGIGYRHPRGHGTDQGSGDEKPMFRPHQHQRPPASQHRA